MRLVLFEIGFEVRVFKAFFAFCAFAALGTFVLVAFADDTLAASRVSGERYPGTIILARLL